jgi:hypothetical protein
MKIHIPPPARVSAMQRNPPEPQKTSAEARWRDFANSLADLPPARSPAKIRKIRSNTPVAFYVQDPVELRMREWWRGRLGDFLMENGITQKDDVDEITTALRTAGVYRDKRAANGIVELRLQTLLQRLFAREPQRPRQSWPISIGFWFWW